MKNSRPRIKYAQIPHSIARCIESLKNPTAVALLSFITRRTVAFGQGFVELSYRQLSLALNIGTRAICNAAGILEERGFIVRHRSKGGSYRWAVVLEKDEILEDPNCIYLTRETASNQRGDKIDRAGGIRSADLIPYDLTILSPSPKIEQHGLQNLRITSSPIEQKPEALNKEIKETNIKKQHQSSNSPDRFQTIEPTEAQSEPQERIPQSITCKTDDEPLHKFCLRELKSCGVSQRIARQLCNEYDHTLIASVLKTAPQRPGIKNLAAYIVSEIKDGGYEQISNSQLAEQDNGSQVSRGQSNGAHHKAFKKELEAPISYRSVEETRAEREALESQRYQQEQAHREKGKLLLERFKNLSKDLQHRLKAAASIRLSQMLPNTSNKERMLRDQTFQRLANRTVLEQFFQGIDEGLDGFQALSRLESNALAA